MVSSVSAQNAQAVFEKVSPSVVVVKGKTVQGSGVAVSVRTKGFAKETTIVTNCHVVKGEAVVEVTHQNKTGLATVKSCDTERDIALLELSGELPTVVTKAAALLKVGESVYAVGAPYGLDLSISEGIVSQLRSNGTTKNRAPLIQTTAAISPGSSGGGLFDAKARLVGITTRYLKGAQALNFAIPSDWIAEASIRTDMAAATQFEQQRPPPVSRCGWTEYGRASDGRMTMYFDPCTVVEVGRFRMVWELFDYRDSRSFGADKTYRSSKIRSAVNCASKRAAAIGSTAYADAMGDGAVVTSWAEPEDKWDFRDAVPDSVLAGLVDSVCK